MVETPDPVETAAPTETTGAVESTGEPASTAQATSGTSTGTLTGPVADLFSRAEQAMRGVTTYHMSIQTDSQGIKSQSEADVEVPDKMRMLVKTEAGDTELIMIGGESYTQVPGTDTYLSIPVGADMGSLRDSTSVLAFADTAEIVGDETIDGVDTTHVRFSYDQDKASQEMAEDANLPTAVPGTLGRANAEVWIAKSTSYFHKYMVTTTGQAAGTTTITFSNYNEPITPPIEKPANVTTMPSP